MDRLFTFGCSYTQWSWPTWADILGKSFKFHANWGWPGLSNRAIAERVAECHSRFKFTENDVVFIQWSSHLRHDYARLDTPEPRGGMWLTRGSVSSAPNLSVFTKDWFDKFWHEKTYYIHTLNNILLTQQLLKSTGCNWYMIPSTDLRYISFTELYNKEDERPNLFKTSPDLEHYEESIWNENADSWLPPLSEFKWKQEDLNWWFNIDKKQLHLVPAGQQKDGKYLEYHLTPRQAMNYVNEVFPLIGIQLVDTTKLIEPYEDFYEKSNGDWIKMLNDLENSGINFDKVYRGY
jgi:hypothetical protein